MCGISIIISKNNSNILEILINSLFQLQNRGYDSAGIAFRLSENDDKNKSYFEFYKQISSDKQDSIEYIEKQIKMKMKKKMKKLEVTTAIGHTRWATHGAKTIANAHPHYSKNQKLILVHNGIIENYKELKDFLIDKAYTFYSETDSEVIANLIEYFYERNADTGETQALNLAIKMLKGTWGLGIMFRDTGAIYLSRNGSPLLFAYNEDLFICTSEIAGFNNLVSNYTKLESNCLYKIENTGLVQISPINENENENKNINGEKIQFSEIKDLIVNQLGDYKHWTIKEICEQPHAINLSLNNGGRIQNNRIKLGGLEKIRENIQNINHIILLGCGTSLNACLLAKIYFERFQQFDTVQAYDASEFTEYNIPRGNGNSLIFFCSQSGETQDLYKNIAICKERNCITIGIINVVDSLIASEVDCGVYLNAGREVAVASTKSFTSSLIILALVSLYFSQLKRDFVPIEYIESLRKIPDQINQLFFSDFLSKIENIKEKILENFTKTSKITNNSIFILGRGKMYPIAREGALKIKEIAYIHAEAYAGGSLKHGPLALLEENTNVILLIDDANKNTMMNTYAEVRARGAYCFLICENDDFLRNLEGEGDKCSVLLLERNNYQEILFIICLQYLAYILSVSRGINPDRPRNLAKVVTVQ